MDDLRDGAIQTKCHRTTPRNSTSNKSVKFHKELVANKYQTYKRAQRARQLDEKESSKSSTHSMATAKSSDDDLPPLEPIITKDEAVKRIQGAQRGLMTRNEERREQTQDDDESTKAPPKSRKARETIDYNTSIDRWKHRDISTDDINFQLHLRGFQMTPEQQAKYDSLKTKGKGKDQSKKQYLINVIEELISKGKWATQVNDELLRKRMEDWRGMKGKGKATKE